MQLSRGPQNHLLVPAQVNGRSATFLLDTGTKNSLLQASRAAAFGVHPSGGEVQVGRSTVPAAQINDLRVGGRALGPVEVGLFDPAQFRGPVPGKGGKSADGLLGLDVLRRHRAVINCRTQQLFFQGDPGRRLN
ncbi:MAG TPA: retropepsin-like aspartic protease, partial [Chthoniobacterales bacterium]|nr:retropepsin-like aspartic protease [Chthoniobacterales bacterium]